VQPQYTDEAPANKVEGTVALEVVISKDGRIEDDVRVVNGLPHGLTERAIQCVRQWAFVPAKLKGAPIDLLVSISVQFAIY